jgi:hypothetical protein
MEQGNRKRGPVQGEAAVSLGELIHEHVRRAMETAVHEELGVTLGAAVYERRGDRRG